MAMMSFPATQAATVGRTSGFVRTIGNWMHAVVSRWHHRAAIKALNELDDRALRDIGLTRPFIAAAVKGELDPEVGRLR